MDDPLATTVSQNDKSKLWHRRLGHVNDKNSHLLKKQGLFGLEKKWKTYHSMIIAFMVRKRNYLLLQE